MIPDPVLLLNLVLCIIIVILGIWAYRMSGLLIPAYIAASFALFGISHLMNLLGMGEDWEVTLIAIRTLAYLLIIYALWRFLSQKRSK